nr:MAG TPA: hypothetical protein [Caudoviricetes sp.]
MEYLILHQLKKFMKREMMQKFKLIRMEKL